MTPPAPHTNPQGNLVLDRFEAADALQVTAHVHAVKPDVCYLNARNDRGYRDAICLDRDRARRLAEVLLRWADQPEERS